MKSAKNLIQFLKTLGYSIEESGNTAVVKLESCLGPCSLTFDLAKDKLYLPEGMPDPEHKRCFNLKSEENCGVVMLLLKVIKKGYPLKSIQLEKRWPSGHGHSAYLDMCLTSPDKEIVYMIEAKKQSEIEKYINLKYDDKTKQLFTYIVFERKTKLASYYSYDFANKREHFYSLFTEDILAGTTNSDDLYDTWKKLFYRNDFIADNGVFGAEPKFLTRHDLLEIKEDSAQIIFKQFLTILRLYSISDKPNAFMKVINLLLSKIKDEIQEDRKFEVKTEDGIFEIEGLRFQYIEGIDTPKSFMKRLNDLYREGMKEYLSKEVIDYTDKEIEQLLESKNGEKKEKIIEAFDNLRLKRNHNFAFMDVYDDASFRENFYVVKDIVKLFESYQFRYNDKYQFLGDFFENLLGTSLKQEAGQFFTPVPLVNFMVKSLPYEEFITQKLEDHNSEFLPRIIDFACGAGHFLVCSMEHTQNIINGFANSGRRFTAAIDSALKVFGDKERQYSWVKKENVVGIDKDYRLAKTAKIATFLNGDGDAKIMTADGVNKFSCEDYQGSVLYKNSTSNEYFDFLISNPPFSIEGYLRNFNRHGITPDDFSLLPYTTSNNEKNAMIEVFFVERAYQLLKPGGKTAIILPQSVLSGGKYGFLRKYMLSHFKIHAMLLTSDLTFSGTTTSPVVFFMTKLAKPQLSSSSLDYDVMLVCSPKYLNFKEKKNAEVDFLGYEFSSNRNKQGVKERESSVLKTITAQVHDWVCSGTRTEELHENILIKKLPDILLNGTDEYIWDIYPKYVKTEGEPLSSFCKVNSRTEKDFASLPRTYLEISNISNSKIVLKNLKRKKTKRYCKEGDILVSLLTPTKGKIAISDGEYMLTTAIGVLSDFPDEKTKLWVYNRLQSAEILKQMNALTDGFKVTYAKISDNNLYNNVLI